jgi:hypothetical protein
VTRLYFLKATGTHSNACYIGDILCASASVISPLPFCLLCENIMIRVCNGQCDCCSFVFETWFLILRKEHRLNALNDIVMGKLCPNRDERMGGG